jgi:hypothetical protein
MIIPTPYYEVVGAAPFKHWINKKELLLALFSTLVLRFPFLLSN